MRRRDRSPQGELSTGAGLLVVSCSQSPRSADRYRVTVEDSAGARRNLVAPDEFVVRRGVREGTELGPEDAVAFLAAAATCDAYDRAVRALARRAFASVELERWLTQHGVVRTVARAQVERLTSQGLINDERFAADFVRGRVARRGSSTWELRRDLARKGVPREIVDAAIGDIAADAGIDDAAVARRAAESKWRTLKRLEPQVAKRRLIGFLRRRGFGGDVVAGVMRDIVKIQQQA